MDTKTVRHALDGAYLRWRKSRSMSRAHNLRLHVYFVITSKADSNNVVILPVM